MGPCTLFNVTFKHQNKTASVIVTAPDPETAQSTAEEVLTERGFTNWTPLNAEPIRAYINDGRSATVIQMAEAAGSHK